MGDSVCYSTNAITLHSSSTGSNLCNGFIPNVPSSLYWVTHLKWLHGQNNPPSIILMGDHARKWYHWLVKTLDLASYPGLLTPAFAACSTNAGEGLVKLITCNDIHLDVGWTCGGVAHSFCTAVKWLSEPMKSAWCQVLSCSMVCVCDQ